MPSGRSTANSLRRGVVQELVAVAAREGSDPFAAGEVAGPLEVLDRRPVAELGGVLLEVLEPEPGLEARQRLRGLGRALDALEEAGARQLGAEAGRQLRQRVLQRGARALPAGAEDLGQALHEAAADPVLHHRVDLQLPVLVPDHGAGRDQHELAVLVEDDALGGVAEEEALPAAGVDLVEDRLHEVVPIVFADPEPLPRLEGVLLRERVDALVGIGAVLELLGVGHAVAVGVRLVRVGAERFLLLVGEAVAVVVGGRIDDGLALVVAVRGRPRSVAPGDRVDVARHPVGDLGRNPRRQQRADDHGDEKERAHVLGGALAARAAQSREQPRDGRQRPRSREGAGRDHRQLQQRAPRVDGRRDGEHEAGGGAHQAGAEGPDHDDLTAARDARQRRLPRAGGPAERGRGEHDQRAGADLRQIGGDGIEQLDHAAHEHEQRQQRRRHTGAGRPQHGLHSR